MAAEERSLLLLVHFLYDVETTENFGVLISRAQILEEVVLCCAQAAFQTADPNPCYWMLADSLHWVDLVDLGDHRIVANVMQGQMVVA